MKLSDAKKLIDSLINQHGDVELLDSEGYSISGINIKIAKDGNHDVEDWGFSDGEKYAMVNPGN